MRWLLAILLSATLSLPAAAGCRLALVLALDISSSVDAAEDRLQREGLAAALTSDEVVAALLAVPGQPVALAVYEWSGRYQQAMLLDWTLLEGRDDVFGAAQRIAGSTRRYTEFPTAIGYALGYAAGIFNAAPDCLFRTLDISGDGRNNEGFGPALAYGNFPLDDVTVNGLVIGGDDEDLAGYYQREVIKGPGAFVETARDFPDFERAMRRKLLRELTVRAVGALPVAPGAPRGG